MDILGRGVREAGGDYSSWVSLVSISLPPSSLLPLPPAFPLRIFPCSQFSSMVEKVRFLVMLRERWEEGEGEEKKRKGRGLLSPSPLPKKSPLPAPFFLSLSLSLSQKNKTKTNPYKPNPYLIKLDAR